MSKQQIKNQYKTTPSGQLVIVLSNTKYTYAHFTEFHETVLNILDNNDLSDLSTTQKNHTVFFINMVLGLLDAPTKNAINQNRKAGTYQLQQGKEGVDAGHVKPSKHDLARELRPTSKEDLKKLLTWIDEVVLLERITVEKMLDEFYSLGIVELKL